MIASIEGSMSTDIHNWNVRSLHCFEERAMPIGSKAGTFSAVAALIIASAARPPHAHAATPLVELFNDLYFLGYDCAYSATFRDAFAPICDVYRCPHFSVPGTVQWVDVCRGNPPTGGLRPAGQKPCECQRAQNTSLDGAWESDDEILKEEPGTPVAAEGVAPAESADAVNEALNSSPSDITPENADPKEAISDKAAPGEIAPVEIAPSGAGSIDVEPEKSAALEQAAQPPRRPVIGVAYTIGKASNPA